MFGSDSQWTQERVNKLAKMWDIGMTGPEMGAALGTSRSAVLSKVRSLGLPKRQNTDIPRPKNPKKNVYYTRSEDVCILRMRASDYTFGQIATQLGRDVPSVRGRHERLSRPAFYRKNEGAHWISPFSVPDKPKGSFEDNNAEFLRRLSVEAHRGRVAIA